MRDLSFDYIKGVLIFLVILGHAIIYINGVDCYYDPLWKIIHSFHMPLFVLISGYFFKNDITGNFYQLCKKQFYRLLVPQFSFVILGFILMPLCWDNFSYLITINGDINIKPLYHYITFAWFLWCIFFCSLFINVLSRCAGKNTYIIIISICILMYVFFEYLPGPLFKNQQIAKQLIFFAIGMWFRQYKTYFAQYKYPILLISVLIISIYIPSLFSHEIHFINYYNWMILAFASCPIVYYIIKQLYNLSLFKHIIIKWGQNSLGLYLIHVFFIRFIFTAFNIKFNVGNIYWNYIICFISSILLSYIIMWIIKLIQKNRISKILFLGEIVKQ